MRAAKSAGGATYSIFDARMVVDTRDQAELLRDLRLALSRSQLELYYQPKIHAPERADHRRRGAAALAPPAARHDQPERLHPDGRTQRPDRRARRLGHRRGLPPGPRLARPGPAHARGHQPVGAPAAPARPAAAHCRRAAQAPDQPRPADLRDHRIGGDGRHRGDDALLQRAGRGGRAHLDRRLRLGLFQPGLPAQAAGRAS